MQQELGLSHATSKPIDQANQWSLGCQAFFQLPL